MASVFETDMTLGLACDVNVLIRTDTTSCTALTEKELSQHCGSASCEHRNSTGGGGVCVCVAFFQ